MLQSISSASTWTNIWACFPSDTLIYGISRGGSKNFNKRTCEHMILGRLRMRARQTKNAPLTPENMSQPYQVSSPFFIASIATLSPFSNLICCKYPRGAFTCTKCCLLEYYSSPTLRKWSKQLTQVQSMNKYSQAIPF